MTVISTPPVVPESINFGITHNVTVSVSPLSGSTQTLELPGARWKASLTYTDLTSQEAKLMKAWLVSLRGMAGRFYLYDYGETSTLNAVTGTPTIETGSTRRLITATTTGAAFVPGDYLEIRSSSVDESRELKMVIAASATGPGTRNYTIEPPIRRDTYVGLDIIYSECKGVFMLANNDQTYWSTRSKAYLNDITIDCIEAIV